MISRMISPLPVKSGGILSGVFDDSSLDKLGKPVLSFGRTFQMNSNMLLLHKSKVMNHNYRFLTNWGGADFSATATQFSDD